MPISARNPCPRCDHAPVVPVDGPAKYVLEGYVTVVADSEEEAVRLLDEAGIGPDEEPVEGVTVVFEGPWDYIEPVELDGCICPAHLLERGGFRGGCPVHA